jgi:riboflavin kinase/FMN adenylyltransferase
MMHTVSTDIHQLAMPVELDTMESVLTIGAFDGIHIGHQDLIQSMVDRARRLERMAGLITFDPHPATVLYPDKPFHYLTTPAEKESLLEPLGLNLLVFLAFEPDLADMAPRAFVQRLRERLHMRELWIGPDFALGRKRQGNPATLRRLGDELGFKVYDVPYVTQGKMRVSSSTIRALLREGEVEQADRFLGRPYTVSGEVVPGAHRGRGLGFPTANIRVDADRALPGYGVYATYAYLGTERFLSVTNVGVRPSFDNGLCSVEAYLVDFDEDIYGRELTLAFVARLRAEQRFEDVGELIAQVRRDIARARQVLSAEEGVKNLEPEAGS